MIVSAMESAVMELVSAKMDLKESTAKRTLALKIAMDMADVL
jgi:hypothetical protein